MAQLTYLASTLLMGLVLLVTAAALTRLRSWRRYSLPPGGGGSATGWSGDGAGDRRTGTSLPGESTLGRVARSPATWYLAFLALAGGVGGGGLLYVTGETALGLALAGLSGVLLGLFFISGVYVSARNAGHNSALATAESVVVLGLLVVGAIAIRLVAL